MNQRALFGIVAILVLASPASAATPTGQRLRTLAGSSFYIGFGADDNFWNLSDAATYQEVARTEFNMLTPGNPLKWDTVHPQQATYNFGPADQHLNFAVAN